MQSRPGMILEEICFICMPQNVSNSISVAANPGETIFAFLLLQILPVRTVGIFQVLKTIQVQSSSEDK